MSYSIVEMEMGYAEKIIYWHYDDPYSIYDMPKDNNSIDELLNGSYFALLNGKDLIGYYCYGASARVPLGEALNVYVDDYLDIGLGLNPDFCSKGFGYEFMNLGLDYFQVKFKTNRFRLTVFDFNERAIKLYHKIGFIIRNYFKVNNFHYFLIMTLER